MELKLICHGMMLFWYRPENPSGAGNHGYRILIPQGLNMAENARVHEVRFGVGAGVGSPKDDPPEPLRYPGNTNPVKTTYFKLQFPEMPPDLRPQPKGPKDERQNLSFYADRLRVARLQWPEIAFVVDIPYPSDEQPIRVTKYGADPYEDGEAVQAFAIAPYRIVGARAFTFVIPDQSETIELTDGTTVFPIVSGPIPENTRLHLYSQSNKPPTSGEQGHLHMINNMLKFRKAKDTKLHDFDLTLNKQRRQEIDPDDFSPPSGLGFRDLLHLWEYNSVYPDVSRFTDPAECGQGGGCFNEPDCDDPECEDPDCKCP